MFRKDRKLALKGSAAFWEGVLIAVLLVVFGFLSYKSLHAGLLLLALCAWRMARYVADLREGLDFFGIHFPERRGILWMIAGLATGVIAWVGYYLIPGEALPLPGIGFFALSAFAVGLVEELVYRGLLYRMWQPGGPLLAILFSALAHTAYKLALLAPYPSVELLPVACWTLFAGLILGALRHFSGSVLPSAANHVVFDVLVYGGAATGPHWVW
ncbi:MAG: type II CAAX prenyl endopeptidase Rce1 family protein [Saprospiraceae bacterium]|jgi:membrane protease YdiL (CAAX protease family)